MLYEHVHCHFLGGRANLVQLLFFIYFEMMLIRAIPMYTSHVHELLLDLHFCLMMLYEHVYWFESWAQRSGCSCCVTTSWKLRRVKPKFCSVKKLLLFLCKKSFVFLAKLDNIRTIIYMDLKFVKNIIEETFSIHYLHLTGLQRDYLWAFFSIFNYFELYSE